MKNEERNLQVTLIEYLKEFDPNSELLPIFRRARIQYIYTKEFLGKEVWNQKKKNVEVNIPIPLLKEAEAKRLEINRVIAKCCPEDKNYGLGDIVLKPKIIESEEFEYKENKVAFENIQNEIIQAIRDAKYAIWIAVAWFTDKIIFEELCKRKREGLNIRIITSEESSNKCLLDKLNTEFELIRFRKKGSHRLHDKFCIIDFEYVMHGSYNWSENAKGNEETWSTSLDRDLVKKFANQFIEICLKAQSN